MKTRTDVLREVVRHLSTAISTATLYRPEHPQVKRLCELALKSLQALQIPESGLSLLFVEDEMIADGKNLGRSLYIHRLARLLRQWQIGHLKILPRLDSDELLQLVTQLSTPQAGASVRPSANLRLGQVQVRYRDPDSATATTPPANIPDNEGPAPELEVELEDFYIQAAFQERHPEIDALDERELARFSDICDAVRKRRKLHVVGISEIVARFIATFTSEAGSFLALAPLRKLDEYTFVHSINVCTLNIAQAMALGISGQLLHDIGVSAMLHDIGKLFVPEEILTKEGKLSEAEWAIIRQHPEQGVRDLLEAPGVPRLALVVAYEHHMKFNGSGYPPRPPGNMPHLVSQITTISDFFDAMRTERSYQGAMEVHQISQVLLQLSGSELNPMLTNNFLRALEAVTRAKH